MGSDQRIKADHYLTFCNNVLHLHQEVLGVDLGLKVKFEDCAQQHTVVERASQSGVKILRKKIARAAQNNTPPHVVKSYCGLKKKIDKNENIGYSIKQ